MEVSKTDRKSWKKNLDPESYCGVDMFYDDERESLLVAQIKDSQNMQCEIGEQFLAKPSSPVLGSKGVRR
jgi:hypothetical protein